MGIYLDIITEDGHLRPEDDMVTQETAEAYEVIEELYGMIWWLAHQCVAPHIHPEALHSLQFFRESMKDVVEAARQNHDEGMEISKTVHRPASQRKDN